MRAQTLLYVVSLTLGYLPATFAAPSSDLAARHDHHHDHSNAGVDQLAAPDKVVEASSLAISPTPTLSGSSSSFTTPSDPSAHGHGNGHGHGHGHGSHHQPQVQLNETDVHHWHHFPPSYLAADFRLSKDQVIFGEELDESWTPEDEGGHRMLAFGHAGTFILAYFGILPIALGLRAANHPIHHLVNLVFLAVATFSWFLVLAYRTVTPNRYEGSSHAVLVNALYFLSVGLTVVDWLDIVKRAIKDYRAGEYAGKPWREVIRHALEAEGDEGDDEHWSGRYEMVSFPGSEEIVFSFREHEEEEEPRRRSLRDTDRSAPSRSSTGSEGTLHEAPLYEEIPLSHHKPALRMGMGAYDISSTEEHGREHEDDEIEPETWRIEEPNSKPGLGRLGEVILTWIRRTQVVIAYVTVLSGFIVYTGMCRANFLPSCMAHYIKGSIFFGYGVLTFARYLGAYADLGWAWNRKPAGRTGPTAEMVECAVIFVYGITQTWMERIGSHSGDPYTVKQVQHISIAVMFWFAGLGGMLLESKRMRKVMSNISGQGTGDQVEPASYSFSFNPLPALVIAVTGLAMAAHHQNYVFQVEIHSLWGILLAGGSIFRMLTYFFLFLRPPVESELPSRPPTEILTSFGWAAGGIVFMLSNEEITFAAMRTGYDDMMAFLNFTVALTCAVFCWEVVVMGVKGWAVGRMNQRVERCAVTV